MITGPKSMLDLDTNSNLEEKADVSVLQKLKNLCTNTTFVLVNLG